MRCIIRHDMDFNGTIIPARTEARVINKLDTDTVDAPGVQLTLAVYNGRIGQSDISNSNVVKRGYDNENRAEKVGILIHASTQAVYMDAGERLYDRKTLYGWEVDKIFAGNVPEALRPYQSGRTVKNYLLRDVIGFLDEQLAAWVEQNCKFRKVTKREYENGDTHPDAEPGTRVLTDEALEKLQVEMSRVCSLLEGATGFTYKFTAGLKWWD